MAQLILQSINIYFVNYYKQGEAPYVISFQLL